MHGFTFGFHHIVGRSAALFLIGCTSFLSACAANPAAQPTLTVQPVPPTAAPAATPAVHSRTRDGKPAVATPALKLGQVDENLLANIETELSTPICGVGYLETRTGQLDALGDFDKLPYLVRIVQTTYTDTSKSYLPTLAIQLIARLGERDRARAFLERFTEDPRAEKPLKLTAARELAEAFHSRVGLPLLLSSLGDPSTQVRADSFSAALPLLQAGELGQVVTLAFDPDSYVLDRVVTEFERHKGLTSPFMRLVETRYASLDADQKARAAFTLQCLGNTQHEPDLAQYLTHVPVSSTSQSLYQRTYLCQELARRGHKVGLDGVAAVIATYTNTSSQAYLGYAIQQFYDHTAYNQPQGVMYTPADGQAIIQWWQQHRAKLSFDPRAKKFL